MAVQPSDQWPKLLVSFYGSRSTKITFYIITNKLVHHGVTSMDSTSLEDISGDGASMRFGWFQIASSQIFYTYPTHLTVVIANICPIFNGHVLIVS